MHPQQNAHTKVLVLGNGPAGISLSAFLAGLTPFYNRLQPHPNAHIHKNLLETKESLIDQDLSWCENVEQLCATGRSLSVLYDTLTRPGADIGEINPSCLSWEWRKDKVVDHIVLGETPIGGSWNDYDPDMIAVSFSSWLDLPGFTISQYLEGIPAIPRLPSMVIAAYMENYTKSMGIRRYFRPHTKVESITKEDDLWVTKGTYSNGRPFTITSNHVVLACGKTKPRVLGIPEESSCSKVVYDVPSLKARVLQDIEQENNEERGRVVVVGDGISSADVVRHCLEKKIPVLHVMRRNDRQLRNILMARLSPAHYAEYHSVYRKMTGKDHHDLYERCTGSEVTAIDDDRVVVSTPKGNRIEEPYRVAAVCIGRETEVSKVLDGKTFFDGCYESPSDPSLFAVGAVAGDHFVRYLVGGCLHVARKLLQP